MRLYFLYFLLVGPSFKGLVCDGTQSASTTSIRRKRRVTTTNSVFTTVADIENYLNGRYNHRATSSMAMMEPMAILDTEVNDWPRRDLSMATDPPIQPIPTCSDQLSRAEAILQILRTITPEPQLLNTVTAQGMAYQWMVSEDPAATTALKDPCNHILQIQQRYGLVVLYYATSGDSWMNNNGWLVLEDECSWSNVTCHADQPTVSALTLCTLQQEFPISIFLYPIP
jgi:hypothetical protein